MNNRTSFIGAWVSKEEKKEIVELAKGMNISVSDLIRHRVIRPMMTMPEVVQNIKFHIDSKFKKLESEIKNQLFDREPIRRTYIEEYGSSIERLRPPPKPINITPEQNRMIEVIQQLKRIIKGEEEYSLIEIPEEEITQRPKTDQIAYIEFKTKQK